MLAEKFDLYLVAGVECLVVVEHRPLPQTGGGGGAGDPLLVLDRPLPRQPHRDRQVRAARAGALDQDGADQDLAGGVEAVVVEAAVSLTAVGVLPTLDTAPLQAYVSVRRTVRVSLAGVL